MINKRLNRLRKFERKAFEMLARARHASRLSGGTMSSGNLKDCMEFQEKVRSEFSDDCNLSMKRFNDLIGEAIKCWSNALARHNFQPLRFHTYDIHIGEVIDENPDYDQNSVAFNEYVQSLKTNLPNLASEDLLYMVNEYLVGQTNTKLKTERSATN